MPPVAIGAVVGAFGAVASGITVVGGALAFTATAGTILASAAVGALTAGAQMLFAGSQKGRSGSIGRSQAFIYREPVPAGFLPYGRCRVAGPLTRYERGGTGSTRNDLWMIMPVAVGRIGGVRRLYDGDQLMWTAASGITTAYAGKLAYVDTYNGSDTQAADAAIIADLDALDANFRGRGIAYVVLRLKDAQKKWPSGPPKMWAEIDGLMVRDPRQPGAPFVNSANWALCVADYLTRDLGGAGLDWDSDINHPSLIAAANLSDEDVETDDGDEPRYQINGVLSTAAPPRDVLNALMPYGVGQVIDFGGEIVIRAGGYAASVATIGKDDLRSSVRIHSAVNMEDEIDGAQGVYVRPDQNYTLDSFPSIVFADYNPAAGAQRLVDVRLERETSVDRAQRVATLTARKNRRRLAVSLAASLAFMWLAPGDRVTVAHAEAGLNSVFEVQKTSIRATPSGSSVVLELLEDAPGFWTWSKDSASQPPAPSPSPLPSPATVEPPGSVTATPRSRIEADGSLTRWIDVEWAASDDFYLDDYIVEWEQDGVDRAAVTPAITWRIDNTGVATAAITVYARNTLGIRSAGVTASAAPVGDTTAPPPPSNVQAIPSVGAIRFRIDPSPAPDFGHFALYEGGPTSNFGSATSVGQYQSTDFAYARLGDDVKRYWVVAVDRSGNASSPAGPYAAAPSRIDQSMLELGLSFIENVTSLPPPASWTGAEYVFHTAQKLLYRHNPSGPSWDAAGADAHAIINKITAGQIETAQIAADAAFLNNLTVEEANIGTAAITNLKIGPEAVDWSKLAPASAGQIQRIYLSSFTMAATGVEYDMGSLTISHAGWGDVFIRSRTASFDTGDIYTFRVYRNGVLAHEVVSLEPTISWDYKFRSFSIDDEFSFTVERSGYVELRSTDIFVNVFHRS